LISDSISDFDLLIIIMSVKKDIRLKHTNNLTDENDSKYVNLAQFRKNTNIDNEGIAEANTIISEWLKEHAPNLRVLTTNVSCEAVQSLIQKLYTHFTLYFEDKPLTFINQSLFILVQRKLYNQRHKMRCNDFKDREATSRNTVSLSSTNTSEWVKMSVHITTSTLIQTQDMTIITDAKTYEIQVKHILPFKDIQGISPATVIDVTPFNSSSAQKVNICSWVSFNIWVNILKEDIQYTYLDIINYSFNDITTNITEDRKFCTVILDVRMRRLSYTEFEVVFKVKDCKLNCLLNSSVHLNNSLLALQLSLMLKCIMKSSQTENTENIIILKEQERSSNQLNKRYKISEQDLKTTGSHMKGIHHDTSDEQASEQPSRDISMSLNRNITEPFMSGTLLRMKQDKRQSDRSDNTLSTRTLSNHTKITTVSKALKEDLAADKAKSQMTDPAKITMIDNASEKDLDINTAESQTADSAKITMIDNALKEDLPVNKTESWTADHAKFTSINKASEKDLDINSVKLQTVTNSTTSDEAHSICYPKLQSTATPVWSKSTQTSSESELIFHEDTVEKLQDIKDIETSQTSMAEEYV